MDNEFLFNQASSLWRVIEMEGRSFPANNISVAVTGFGDVEDGIQGIQGFLVKNQSSAGPPNSARVEVGGKRKRDSLGITKFFTQKVEDTVAGEDEPMLMYEQHQANQDHPDTEGQGYDQQDLEEVDDTTYSCKKCDRRIPFEEMEVHDDYHVALELSMESPRPPKKPRTVLQATKRETRKPPKRGKMEEKGQMKLEFSGYTQAHH